MAGYNVNALVNYTNEQNFPILKASILGVKQLQFSHCKQVSNPLLL
jgi:hypothetical protein